MHIKTPATGVASDLLFVLLASSLAASAAGPASPLYLTGAQVLPGLPNEYRINVVQGPNVIHTWAECLDPKGAPNPEFAIAVGATVRTLGYTIGQFGSEYGLSGTPACNSYVNSMFGSVYDGTTDGLRNYTIDLQTGTVYATDLNWQNPVPLFILPADAGQMFMGITYDATDNTLWVSTHVGPEVRHYTMDGTLLGTFPVLSATDIGINRLATALALDPADGTLWVVGAGVAPPLLAQYSRQGLFLSKEIYSGLQQFDVTGGEFQFRPASTADLALSKQASASTVAAGQNVTYTLLVTNNGPVAAPNVVVTDSLPSPETFVSCTATQGGVCGGTGNNRTISFASLAAGATATITIVAQVNCNVPNGTSISNPATVSAGITDSNPANNTAFASVTGSNPAPVVKASVANGSLWPAKSNLVNVGLAAPATDNCGTPAFQVQVFGDEDDETPTAPGVVNSPDARDIALSTLRLRAERVDGGNGRVYLIVVKATDSAGGVGFGVQTVVVPASKKPAEVNAVNTRAASARAYALANSGNPPEGYVEIGNGPVIGPKQ